MGTVAAVGERGARVRVGERVSAEGHIVDLTCLLCRTGQAHICERVKIIGVDRDGAFAEYIAMPEVQRVAARSGRFPTSSPPSSIRSATPCTP